MFLNFNKFKRFLKINKINKFMLKLLIVAICLIMIIMIISILNLRKCQRNSKNVVNHRKYRVVPQKFKNKILILSFHRSGSSFLGNLLQKSWSTFYVYEPLHYLGNYIYVRELQNKAKINKSMTVLNNVFKCKNLFKSINKSPIIWVPKLNYIMANMTRGRKLNKDTKHICDSCKNIVVKTVRIDVEYLANFSKRFSSGSNMVRSILLFRDPRAIISSRLSLPTGMSFCNDHCRDPRLLCDHFRSNIKAIIKLKKDSSDLFNHLTIIRFEDLSLNPKLMAKTLFERLSLNYTIEVEKWIETNTQVDNGGPFKTSRNSKERIISWIKNIDKTGLNLSYIQTHCADVMHVLGYKTITLEDIQRAETLDYNNLVSNEIPLQTYYKI